MRVRLEPADPEGEEPGGAYLPIPDNLLEAVGLREGDLVEIDPFIRRIDNVIVERVITIRKLRH